MKFLYFWCEILVSFSWGCSNSELVWVHEDQSCKLCPFFFVPWTTKNKNPSFPCFPGSCYLEGPFMFAGISCLPPEFQLRLLICDRGVPSATFFLWSLNQNLPVFRRTALTKIPCWPGNNIIHCWHSCRRFSHCSPDSSRPSAFPCMQDSFLWWFFTQSFRKWLYLASLNKPDDEQS